MEEILKKHINGLHTIISVTENDKNYVVYYIYFNKDHRQKYDTTTTSLKKELLKGDMRDYKIENILISGLKIEDEFFDVESVIYTEEQRTRLDKLRRDKSVTTHVRKKIDELRKDYTENFQIGDPVFYKNTPGFISFKHSDKEDSLTRWTVRIKDVEYRYVTGLDINSRVVEDLSYLPIDPKLDKLSTEKLLRMYKGSRVKGKGNPLIKRILNEREHVKSEEKIIICNR